MYFIQVMLEIQGQLCLPEPDNSSGDYSFFLLYNIFWVRDLIFSDEDKAYEFLQIFLSHD